MIRTKLKNDLVEAVKSAGFDSLDDIVLSIPQNEQFGDSATNVALQLAKQNNTDIKQTPQDIANNIISHFPKNDYIEEITVAGPGFINFKFQKSAVSKQLDEILSKGENYGNNEMGSGRKARVEYVSANPTGPLHFGNARGGPIGDVISSVLESSGFEVLREYIDNDKGNQIFELGKTLATRAGLLTVPEESLTYKGEYTGELAEKVKIKLAEKPGLSGEEIITEAGKAGAALMFEEIISDCRDLGISFDNIIHESDLQKKAPKVLGELEKTGLLKKYEGAVWFAPKSDYLKDREAVVVKSDGEYTYFTSDIVYHKEKFDSGYDLVVDIFGSNTSGHVPKLRALAEVLNFDQEKFKVILYQFVRIKRGQEIVRMSKRAGNFVTAREVLDEVGKDAFRFFILMFDTSTHLDFDLNLAKEQSNKNPVYYVQYAHARMSNILAKSKIKNQRSKINSELLTTKEELRLIKHLVLLPDLVEEIAADFQVHKLTSYSLTLADLFHKFYELCRVLDDDNPELTQARLALVSASKQVLRNTLKIMGISAPERM